MKSHYSLKPLVSNQLILFVMNFTMDVLKTAKLKMVHFMSINSLILILRQSTFSFLTLDLNDA